MRIHKNQLFKPLLGSEVALLMFAQPSQAIDNALTLYLWATGISGSTTLGSQTFPQQPVEVSFDDVLDKLDFGFQVHYEGVGEQWGGGLDNTYIKLSDTNDVGVNGEVKAMLTELFGLNRANRSIDVLASVPFMSLNMSVSGTKALVKIEGDRSLTDVFAGARAKLPISDSVLFVLRSDVGTGGSGLVWNVFWVSTGTYPKPSHYAATIAGSITTSARMTPLSRRNSIFI